MTLKIIHKNNTSAGQAPASGDLDIGEIAVNSADAKLYTKDNDGAVQEFISNFEQSGSGAVARSVESRLRDVVSVKDFGAVGDGVADDTAALQAAFATTATGIYFPDGLYRIVDSAQDGTPVLLSTIADRVISGPGRLTATTSVYTALRITGARTKVHLGVAGNNEIGVAIQVQADACEITNCDIRNLYQPANQWKAIGIEVRFEGNDWSILVANNVFDTINAVGDSTGGNGVGLSRAVLLSATTDVTKTSIVANNIITSVIGEEGDSVAVISSDGAGTYYDFPVLIANNAITTWTRRGVKTQSNKAVVKNNTFRNTFTSNPGNLQHAVSLVQGGDHVVDGNVFINCRYAGQVVAIAASAGERVDNITVTNNVITGIGAETTNNPIYLKTFGENVVVTGNKILCPDLAGSLSIAVISALSGAVIGNVVDTNTTEDYSYSGSTNILIDGLSVNQNSYGFNTTNDSGDAAGVVVSGSPSRALTLYNWDSAISNDEIVSRIQFHQNDNGSDAVNASIRAVAVGSTGALSLAFHTGGSTQTPDEERLRIGISGNVTPAADNTQSLGSGSFRWSEVFAGTGTINTSDAREKQDSETLADAEKQVALTLKNKIKKFRYIDAVDKKQDAARIHIGVIAQEVEQAFLDAGLDPERYGMFCKDEWYELDGKVLTLEEGEQVPQGAIFKDRLGIRYDELICFVLASI